MKISCLVIDDDPMICDLVLHFCSKIDSIEYCVSAHKALDGLHLISNSSFDLIFLDFNLPDMKGQDFLELKPKGVKVVMITSEIEFAVTSYEYEDVIDYLLKPLTFDRFSKAINKYFTTEEADPLGITSSNELFVKDGKKLVKIDLEQILYCKSEANYVSFISAKGQTLSLMRMKDLEDKLPPAYLRIHRSYIINVNKLDFVTTEEVSIENHLIPIGKKYRERLLKRIQSI